MINKYEGHFSILNAGISYMPTGVAIAEVKSFDDPNAAETIKNIRKIRFPIAIEPW